MKKEYKWILMTYGCLQLSGFLGVFALTRSGLYKDVTLATVHWGFVSFMVALVISQCLLFHARTSKEHS